MINIDAKGKNCPIPVVLTKKEIDKGAQEIMIEVDNEVAVENVSKLAASMGFAVAKDKTEGGFMLSLAKTGEPIAAADTTDSKGSDETKAGEWALFVSGDSLGSGHRDLGTSLMKMFFYTLSESADLPSHILLMNEGVKLATTEIEVVEHLQNLADAGVKILVCGTCLEFYGLKDELKIGNISNMYDIQEQMLAAVKVLSL